MLTQALIRSDVQFGRFSQFNADVRHDRPELGVHYIVKDLLMQIRLVVEVHK